MKVRVLIFLVLGIISGASGQNTIDLIFTAVDDGAYIRLDSIKVMNWTQGGSANLYWPDTTLTYQITPGDLLCYVGYAMDFPVGIGYVSNKVIEFRLFQSYSNPVRDQAVISVYLPSKGAVNMMVTDIRGRLVANVDRELCEGTHSFIFRPGDEGMYILSARWNGNTESIKILTEGITGGKTCKLEYIGRNPEKPSSKQSQLKGGLTVQESGILDTPDFDTTYTFQFATNIPCPGTPTVEFEGRIYNTIQIFSQCWLKENLDVGTMISGTQNQTNNSIIEKYCINNEPDSCTKYGGLYQWDEMMQYNTQHGVQGICPPGWHLPTDEEWLVLEGVVDSQYGIGDIVWNPSSYYRGYDAGTNLKTTSGWYLNGNGTDLYGFSGLACGFRDLYGSFNYVGYYGFWWTSTLWSDELIFLRTLDCFSPGVYRTFISPDNLYGYSVRCIKDKM
jgi:uncharacterized protein (TIGR02145 family)